MDDAEKRAEELLSELDAIARDVCRYEFGLPIGHDDAMPKMVGAAVAAIREAEEAEREWCIAIILHDYGRTSPEGLVKLIRASVPARPAQTDRDFFRFVQEVMAAHPTPILALVGFGKWRIVSDQGEPIGDPATTPYEAWKSAAEKVKVAA